MDWSVEMAHPSQQQFCERVRDQFPSYFADSRVLEIGSRNVNGTLRDLFENCDYTGIDAVDGKDVDVVCLGHEFEAPDESFDVVCSAEAFEHDPHASKTVARMVTLLRPGGLFFMTCAGEGRPEHGTTRTGKRYGPDPGYYGNVSLSDFLTWIEPDRNSFCQIHIEHNQETCDLYFFAIKSG